MNTAIDNIIKSAKEMGACSLLTDRMKLHSLTQLMFKSQGIEFCTKYNFPSYDQLRTLNAERIDLFRKGVFVDYGSIETWLRNVFAVGQTDLVCICRRPKFIYNIVLGYGAHVTIKATDYAVVNIYTIGEGCTYDIENDGTAIIFGHSSNNTE